MTDELLNIYPAETPKGEITEYPKWVKPDPSHFVTRHDRVSGQDVFKGIVGHEFFVDRDTGDVTVLVQDAADEAAMTKPKA